MSRAKTFKLFDVARALRAAEAAKVPVDRLEIDKFGTIKIFPKTNDLTQREKSPNEWDEVA
jgi:hypothetical protein